MKEMNMDSKEESSEYNPFDALISRVDSYIKDPKMVSPKTLSELKSEIEDLKNSYESDDMEDSENEPMEKEGKPSIMIMIGKMKKKRGEENE